MIENHSFMTTPKTHCAKATAPKNRSSSQTTLLPPGVFVPGKRYTPTKELVRIPYGLTREEQKRFLQDDIDSINN